MKQSLILKSNPKNRQLAAQFLQKGKIVIVPTDTIYGLVTSALNRTSVEKIYKLKGRDAKKPLIILISSISDLSLFEVNLNSSQQKFLSNNWPNPLSVILNTNPKRFRYLHRGRNLLAFRLPKPIWLRNMLKVSGPIVAPSANLSDQPPSLNINDAKKYFKNKIDLYLDAGTLNNQASTLISLESGKIEILRQGSFVLNFDPTFLSDKKP